MTYTQEELEALSRKEVQAIAKQHGVKANQKTVLMIEQLVEVFSSQMEEEEQEPACEEVHSEQEMEVEEEKEESEDEEEEEEEHNDVVVESVATPSRNRRFSTNSRTMFVEPEKDEDDEEEEEEEDCEEPMAITSPHVPTAKNDVEETKTTASIEMNIDTPSVAVDSTTVDIMAELNARLAKKAEEGTLKVTKAPSVNGSISSRGTPKRKRSAAVSKLDKAHQKQFAKAKSIEDHQGMLHF